MEWKGMKRKSVGVEYVVFIKRKERLKERNRFCRREIERNEIECV